jgi:hypothetical protein
MSFTGIEIHVFQGYVLFHTARIAWEARKFELQSVPEGWKRQDVAVKGPETLRGMSFSLSFPMPRLFAVYNLLY